MTTEAFKFWVFFKKNFNQFWIHSLKLTRIKFLGSAEAVSNRSGFVCREYLSQVTLSWILWKDYYMKDSVCSWNESVY